MKTKKQTLYVGQLIAYKLSSEDPYAIITELKRGQFTVTWLATHSEALSWESIHSCREFNNMFKVI